MNKMEQPQRCCRRGGKAKRLGGDRLHGEGVLSARTAAVLPGTARSLRLSWCALLAPRLRREAAKSRVAAFRGVRAGALGAGLLGRAGAAGSLVRELGTGHVARHLASVPRVVLLRRLDPRRPRRLVHRLPRRAERPARLGHLHAGVGIRLALLHRPEHVRRERLLRRVVLVLGRRALAAQQLEQLKTPASGVGARLVAPCSDDAAKLRGVVVIADHLLFAVQLVAELEHGRLCEEDGAGAASRPALTAEVDVRIDRQVIAQVVAQKVELLGERHRRLAAASAVRPLEGALRLADRQQHGRRRGVAEGRHRKCRSP
mmetsp:Transcript_10116/g.33426  ORF Transcript_10116/g.33426 Transcript_10116/m.33426 type:complete len:316 (-) Transcript_10116:1070-2017(-)